MLALAGISLKTFKSFSILFVEKDPSIDWAKIPIDENRKRKVVIFFVIQFLFKWMLALAGLLFLIQC